MSDYILMHKDIICGILTIDDESGAIQGFKGNSSKHTPFLGNADFKLITKWWEARAIPANRKTMVEIIRQSGCASSKDYLAKNLALSMTDSYWVCPVDIDLKWSDVNLYQNAFSINNGKLPYHNATSYDPNASLGGQMDKYWDVSFSPAILVKTAYKYNGQQALNEVFATLLHEQQKNTVPFVRYKSSVLRDGGIICMCESFTDINTEFIPAMELIDSTKISNNKSLYDAYIDICVNNGIDRNCIQDFMDYQTLTDFIISNTDEHLMNFGILRNPDTLEFLGPAPIFDSGNSMFYSDISTTPYNRASILERKITAFHDKEEAMLKHVKNRDIVKYDLLPSPEEVKHFYLSNGIPEEKANFISKNYEVKLSLLHDFQLGKTISLYKEKQKLKSKNNTKDINITITKRIEKEIERILEKATEIRELSPKAYKSLQIVCEELNQIISSDHQDVVSIKNDLNRLISEFDGIDDTIRNNLLDVKNNIFEEGQEISKEYHL